jgi:hypothetical protein
MRFGSWLLLLALSLVLRPTAAGAEVRAAPGEATVSAAAHVADALRPPAPLPAVAKAPSARRADGGGTPKALLAPPASSRTAAAPLRDGLRAAHAADAVRPSCERLPYPPTGPPAR